MAGAGGAIVVDGQLDTISSTTNNNLATITLDGPGSTTTLNAGIVTAGAAIDIQDSVVIGNTFTILLDTTNGGAVAGGAAINIENALDGDNTTGANETLQLNAGNAGAITINTAGGGGDITGGTTSLNLTIVDSGSTTITGPATLLTLNIQDTSGTVAFNNNLTATSFNSGGETATVCRYWVRRQT